MRTAPAQPLLTITVGPMRSLYEDCEAPIAIHAKPMNVAIMMSKKIRQ